VDFDIVQVTGMFGGLLWFGGFWLIALDAQHAFLVSILGELCMAAAGWFTGAYFLTFWCAIWIFQDLIAMRGSSLSDDTND